MAAPRVHTFGKKAYICVINNTVMPHFSSEKRHIINTLILSGCLIGIILLVFVVERGLGTDFYYLGVHPREVNGLPGILTLIFVHAGWGHLINNCISLFILTASLFYFYGRLADKIFLLCWFCSGLLLWVIGRDSWHIGASGLIYALAFFLCLSGFLRKHIPLVAIALVVVLFYGNMVWHVFPWQADDPVSWEGHLSGAVVGVVLALIYRKQGPQRPVKDWHEELDSDDDKDLAQYAESFELEGEKQASEGREGEE